jgi:hypothetical protein
MDNCKEDTWMGTLKRFNSPIKITKFVMFGLCFFVHAVEYTIIVTRTFIIVAKIIMLSSNNGCNQNWMTLFISHLHFQ